MDDAFSRLVEEKAARARADHEARMRAMAGDRAAMERDNAERARGKETARLALMVPHLASADLDDHPPTTRSPALAIPPPPPARGRRS